MKTLIEKTSDKLVKAFLTNKIIAPIPSRFSKKLSEAQKLRKLCESKIKLPVIGFKAAGTGIPLIKKFKEKEPFYASVYERNFLKSGKSVKINKSTLGIELEVCFKIKKSFFSSKNTITMKNDIQSVSKRLVNAYNKNKLINPIPEKFCKNIKLAHKLRLLCESKINDKKIGFKAGGTIFALLKKLKEKEPFHSTVFQKNLIKTGGKVKVNKYALGIEVEVYYIIKKSFFDFKGRLNPKNVTKFITHMGPCIEVVGFRQRKKGIKYLGDLCSDFGVNIKFITGPKKKFKKLNLNNLKTNLKNNKGLNVKGNTNTVYINPLNSLKFVLNKIRKEKVKLDKDFYVFTGSTVGVVPIKNKGEYIGKVDKIGSVRTTIN